MRWNVMVNKSDSVYVVAIEDDPTPHKHYDEPPFACARCLECRAYVPAEVQP